MKKSLFLFLMALSSLLLAEEAGKILASWDFSKPDELTSNPIPLKLRGASRIENGMLISTSTEVEKASGAVVAKKDGRLNPPNAFRLIAEFMFDEKWQRPKGRDATIFDAKYVYSPNEKQTQFHKGFAFYLRVGANNSYTPVASFGFGDKSSTVSGKSVVLEPGKLHTAELFFNATGKVFFKFDDKDLGSKNVLPGTIAPTDVMATIGDRTGSSYNSFGGAIKKVTLIQAEYNPIVFVPDSYKRRAFERGEEKVTVFAKLCNFTNDPLKNITVRAKLENKELTGAFCKEVPSKGSTSLSWELSPWLLPGKYNIELTAFDASGKELAKDPIPFFIAPAYGDFMPVVLWGGQDKDVVRDLGFTHQANSVVPIRGHYTEDMLPESIASLDNCLEHGLYAYTSIYAKYRFLTEKRFLRKDRDGKERGSLEASNPGAQKEYYEVAEETSRFVGEHPAWDAALLNSEVRDSSRPSFTGVEEAAYKAFSGLDVPDDVNDKYPKSYKGDKSFPWDRIIPDNDVKLNYYRWFWREGDGWNNTQSLLHDALHKNINHHFFTFYDPVVRVLPQWGSGGHVDVVSQWTYCYPDPIKIGQATDEVIAMAQGNPNQKVMKMTQAIWYRSATAPKNVTVENPPEWLEREKEAAFITIAPDALREALWSKLSRRIDGIMYHGSGSLIATEKHSYRYTNPDSKYVLRDMANRVIKPLGPVLKKIPERKAEVAILESFTGWLYAPNNATMGWSNKWTADLHLALQWAHIQPSIIFEEHLFTDMTDGLKVIIIPAAEVLTDKVLAKLQELQRKGVCIVGDESLPPALMVDIRIKSFARDSKDPMGSKAKLQKYGEDLAKQLKPYFKSPFTAANNDLVVRRRGTDSADYVFVLNDKRMYGDYIGQWKRCMEKGLRNNGSVSVNHSATVAYDLLAHKSIPLFVNEKVSTFDVMLEGGDGTIVLLLDKEIVKTKIGLSKKTVKLGDVFKMDFQVLSHWNTKVKALLPMEVTLLDCNGNKLPGSGYYAAEDGALAIEEVAAPNMTPGTVTVKVRDLASGILSEDTFEVVAK